jgi:hypothetical protein
MQPELHGEAGESDQQPTVKPRKAQSVLEFLTTYGWAILILIIVLAVLYVLGIFNPSVYAPNTCTLPSQLNC